MLNNAFSIRSVGYAFAYGGADSSKKGFIGNTGFFLSGFTTGGELIGWFFQFAFAATAATIVAGTVAERCKFEAYLAYSLMLTGFVYPVIVYSIWSSSGFLSAFNGDPFLGCGMHDFAGSGVVHLTGGVTALIAAKILGPRIGRFHDADGNLLPEPVSFAPHSVSLQVLGTFVLWVGWYGFNPGSTLLISNSTAAAVSALAAVTTTIAAAAGSVSALFMDMFLSRMKTGHCEYDITMCMNGALAGLVAVTAGW
jgi:Amt family ammonium transporter